ncbi:hypothetical protein, partial [Klebsiella pneumoniae]|uniref:hypothetical protein n=1 Tax=Klebsiella pneumoniae TaxID=573 RepID=UPI003CF654BE
IPVLTRSVVGMSVPAKFFIHYVLKQIRILFIALFVHGQNISVANGILFLNIERVLECRFVEKVHTSGRKNNRIFSVRQRTPDRY